MDERFIEHFESRVGSTISKYNLIEKGEKVLVACSGGKDSTTALYLLNKFGYNPEAITIDLLMGDYSERNLECIRKFCREYKIRLHEISFRDEFGHSVCYLRSVASSKNPGLGSCTVCGVLRRYLLNKKARELKARRIVTGHNLDDEAQTVFMNLVQGQLNRLPRLGPRTGHVKDKKFVERIKPLYFCPEDEVEKYSRMKEFPVVYDPCPCSTDSYRSFVRKMLDSMENKHSGTKEKIVINFLDIRPDLVEHYSDSGGVEHCKLCGEPSSQDLCRTCKLRQMILQ